MIVFFKVADNLTDFCDNHNMKNHAEGQTSVKTDREIVVLNEASSKLQ